MSRSDRKGNRALLNRVDEKSSPAEIPVDARSRLAIESVKSLYAMQTAVYQESLRGIAAAAVEAEGIDQTVYNYLDIDRMVWCHRERQP